MDAHVNMATGRLIWGREMRATMTSKVNRNTMVRADVSMIRSTNAHVMQKLSELCNAQTVFANIHLAKPVGLNADLLDKFSDICGSL